MNDYGYSDLRLVHGLLPKPSKGKTIQPTETVKEKVERLRLVSIKDTERKDNGERE